MFLLDFDRNQKISFSNISDQIRYFSLKYKQNSFDSEGLHLNPTSNSKMGYVGPPLETKFIKKNRIRFENV